MRTKSWILMAFLCCSATTVQAAGPVKLIKVAVDCSGDDNLGRRLCFTLKEKIRGSKGFELVQLTEAEVDPYRIRGPYDLGGYRERQQ